MHRKKIAASLMALVVLAVIPAFGEDSQVKGMIMSRTGDTLVVNTGAGKTRRWCSPMIRRRRTTGGFWAWKNSNCPIRWLYPDLRC